MNFDPEKEPCGLCLIREQVRAVEELGGQTDVGETNCIKIKPVILKSLYLRLAKIMKLFY